ncbi:MAG: DNA internalization-related competence protein ComEC/Rec2 [Pigmentiphaga sp.]|uniref:DNA internalization-related competence protein ComEC/Rec2 n=1 Tax=Pigmentiphaga sp. TaxID=1977564 RepID=UPI0029A50C23|nr:DNA internalization-related competence protein ComEC/Rec2 [Pigmentiphaga sp.]MDX3905669.1 DNA internalization-related competence protein ComEC/Rec2 [Pigmentiphaga sp.]
MWRLALVAFVLGTAWVHVLPAVPRAGWTAVGAGALLLALGAAWRRGRGVWRGPAGLAVVLAMAGMVAGTGLALVRIDLRLQDALSPERENRPIELDYLVTSLSTATGRGQRFQAELLAPPPGVPRRVQLAWYGKAAEVVPGEIWRASVVLKRPHGNLNPHGFDYEAYLFEHGIRATGSVRGRPRRLGQGSGFGVLVQRARHDSRAVLREILGGKRYGPVLTALAMGDQAGVDKRDWETFSRAGITHLVSISGLHVTMLAALAGWIVLQGWKCCSWRGTRLAERNPAQVAAAAAALVVAWLYCLLAGWGVPAQRTFFMLSVIGLAAMLRLPLSGSRVLAVAAALVCALDPWAPLATGFWLSFGAVALLVLAGSGRWRWREAGDLPWRTGLAASLREGARAQVVLTVGLLPALGLMFQQISLVSPLANALAIPVVSLLVTPLALAALALAMVPGLSGIAAASASLAHAVFAVLMQPVQWLAHAQFAAHALAAPPWPLVALGLAGVAWAMQPRGLPCRWLALVLLTPMLAYRPARPEHGAWQMTMLDVGQGSAIVVETSHTTLLFDTGPPYGDHADAGSRVIWPYLRARGIRRLDELVVSHADVDHAGGLRSLLAAVPVGRVHASYDLALREPGMPTSSRCADGQRWTRDGVEFSFVHPARAEEHETPAPERNGNSCVLLLRGQHHSALLTGDIGKTEEARLARRGAIAVDVLAVPHHGSRHSSSGALVAATSAAHAVAQAGYLNRYRHPHPQIVRRWQRAGTIFHRTDRHGAVVFSSDSHGLTVERERDARRRYWHASAS